jgi:hypothetical protein
MATEPKTNRRKSKFAGPLDWPKAPDSSFSVTWLRFQFLLISLKLEPTMMEGLEELLRLRMSLPKTADGEAAKREYRAELVNWLQRYNLLDGEWCGTWLRQTLRNSHWTALCYPAEPPQVEIEYIFFGPPMVEGPTTSVLEWNPTESSRETMERRYSNYLNEVEAAYRQAGYGSSPERREPGHVCWLAGYQVCGWSRKRIAEALRVDRAAVVRGINKLAHDIVLTPREPGGHNSSQTVEIIRERLRSVSIL